MPLNFGKGLPIAAIAFCAVSGAWAIGGDLPPAAHLDSEQIVAEMQSHSLIQSQELKSYTSLRTYQVEYRGYDAKIAARMEVEVRYNAASGKSFRIVSQSGSPFLCNKVLKRAVDSEEEAAEDKGSTALTPANYRFQLTGVESVNSRPAYVLDVEPIKPTKFLYRGKIWVDSQDFAVVKIDATPARNPSIWIAKTTIRHTSAITDGFWLPEETRSQTWVRIGGTAVLTIVYGDYQVVPAHGPAVARSSGAS
jgi:hypothetical protein